MISSGWVGQAGNVCYMGTRNIKDYYKQKLASEKTGNGIIICKDGFKATTVSPQHFLELTRGLAVQATIVEVDESSLFCEIRKNFSQ